MYPHVLPLVYQESQLVEIKLRNNRSALMTSILSNRNKSKKEATNVLGQCHYLGNKKNESISKIWETAVCRNAALMQIPIFKFA